jgi:hypothetical protein
MTTHHLVLQRAITLLVGRLQMLEAKLEAGEDLWGEYRSTVATLVAAMAQLAPGTHGELLTTKEMASRLNLTPKTLLKRRARGQIKATLAKGKLIRWRGDEATR